MKSIVSVLLLCLSAVPMFAGNRPVMKKEKSVPNQYVVMFDPQFAGAKSRAAANDLARLHGGSVRVVWDDSRPGMTVTLPSHAVAEVLARDPRVESVEEDGIYELAAGQTNAPWSLDRVDQVYLPLDGTYNYCTDAYRANAYIVDTGVRRTHQEFWSAPGDPTSRVAPGYQVPDMTGAAGTADNPCPNPATDCPEATCANAGHGTAVASVVGGRTYGVAKGVTIIPVRVANCSGTSTDSRIISGLKWIRADFATRPYASVVNMSLSKYAGVFSETDPIYTHTGIEKEIIELTKARVTVVVAAGNHNSDSRMYTPARMAFGNSGPGGKNLSEGRVISAGGSTRADNRWICGQQSGDTCISGAPGSNYGAAVDVFAPAAQIPSASILSDTAVRTVATSGTSFSAALVTGRIARALDGSVPGGYDPYYIFSKISTEASVVMNSPSTAPLNGSPNRLLFVPKMVSRYCN
ncbi:MAG TPA: S8 family serine peptidase [Thermoanaerobaculia bacterium]